MSASKLSVFYEFGTLGTVWRQPLLLTDLLSLERIKIPLQARSKAEILSELVQVIADDHAFTDVNDVLRAVREREAVLSTGIGNGVAIPHGKSPAVPGLMMAAGCTAAPIEFDSLDGQPVQLFFLLVGPETAAGAHIKALSRISRLVRRDDARQRLTSATSAEDFLRALQEFETE
jgi:mannitol/fructose-specific phosphotransferase system IIA component (Ntr-type)